MAVRRLLGMFVALALLATACGGDEAGTDFALVDVPEGATVGLYPIDLGDPWTVTVWPQATAELGQTPLDGVGDVVGGAVVEVVGAEEHVLVFTTVFAGWTDELEAASAATAEAGIGPVTVAGLSATLLEATANESGFARPRRIVVPDPDRAMVHVIIADPPVGSESSSDAAIAALERVQGRPAATEEQTASSALSPRVGDHWHAIYAVWGCAGFVDLFTSARDPHGIHSHQDGLIHIHPFGPDAEGGNATFLLFLETMQVEVTSEGVRIEDVDPFAACAPSETTNEVVLVRWETDDLDTEPDVWRGDAIAEATFENDREVWVLAVVPVGTPADQIPPPTADRFNELARNYGG